jgi:hypothetical protein
MASEIKVDTVSEKTSGSGVTIDGLLIKDGGISGDVSLIGTTPTFTIGDAGAEDAALVFDGNAQDFYIALDDSADDLVIGLGSTVGTTPAVSIDENLQVKIVATTASTSATTGSFIAAGGAGIAADLHVGDDVTLISDSAVLGFGADKDTTLTHTDGTGLTLNSTNKLTFGDAASYIQQSSDGVLKINGEATVDIDATAAITLAATGVPVTVGGIPFYRDANDSIYTHDVSGTQSTAEANTAFGVGSLDAVTSGDANTSIGNGALSGNTTGSNNIAIGKAAINAADAETHNLAIGLNALSGSVNGGEYNIAIGNYTLDALTSGDNNTAVGYNAGTAVTTGSKNTMVGQMSGYDVADGGQNTLVGVEAGANVSSGNENTLVGERCGDVITTGSSNQMLGTNIDADAADGDHQIIIGHNFVGPGDNYFAFGKASNIVSNLFTSNANWSRSSDRRKKRNIKDQKLGLDFINDLRTVTFQWKSSNEFPKEWREYSEENNMDMDVIMHGFIAQEVKEAMDKHGEKDFGGWSENKDGMQNTSREMFVIPLIKAVQELSTEVKELKAKLEDK